jgi:DNA polymerase-1
MGFRSLVMEYAPTADTVGKDYSVVDSVEGILALADEIRAATRIGLRVLPDAPAAIRAGIVGISFALGPRRARYVPVTNDAARGSGDLFGSSSDATPATGVPLGDVLRELKPVLEDRTIAKVGHDLKFDAIVLARHGITLQGLETDTMLASYLLDATRSSHPLEELALEHAGYKALRDEDICGRGAKAISFRDVPIETALDYVGERADLALQLDQTLRGLLEQEELASLYRDLEMPLIPVLVDIERAGIRVDGPALTSQSRHVDQELAARSAQIFEMAGEEFNINSPQQLSRILFDKLQLPSSRRNIKTKTASTAVEVLEELALAHDMPRLILEWRALQKLKGTYIDALPQLVNPDTGRVHTCFNQAVAATGRLSSSDPNLQNIPIRTALGREIRGAFIAEPRHVLISADYSQIELRVLAHLSEDAALIDAFRQSVDIHDRTAAKVFGDHSGLSEHELRRRAKIINYALLYGKTAFTLAKDIGVTQQAAQEFINAYFAGFPSVRKFIDDLLQAGRTTGVVKTMFGRRRLVPDLTSRNVQIRSSADRYAVNFPIQGSAADILKRAMIDVHQALTKSRIPARMILTVHDELLFEAPREAAEETTALVREHMEGAVTLKVPLTVDAGVGENWKEAKS